MPFRNRADAGRRLAEALSAYLGKDLVVLATPVAATSVIRLYYDDFRQVDDEEMTEILARSADRTRPAASAGQLGTLRLRS